MAKKDTIVSTQIARKEFAFSKDNVNLSFTLRVDNTSELRTFSALLDAAKQAVELEISNLKN